MEFKDRLKQLRHENKMTQSKLAEKLDYGYTAIANYESGKNQPSIGVLIKIASIFQVSLDYLLGVTDIRKPLTENTESAEYMEFFQYFSMLSADGKKELTLYTQWLLDKQTFTKIDFPGSTARHRRSSPLIASQEQEEYKLK